MKFEETRLNEGLNDLVLYFKKNPNQKLLEFTKIITEWTNNLLKSSGSNRLLDICVSFKKQLNNLEDTWFSQETMLKIKCQKEQAIECEEVKTDEALWKVKFAESVIEFIKDNLINGCDSQKWPKIFELLKRASREENPRIEGCSLNKDFWRYQLGNEESELMLSNIYRITCGFNIQESTILVLRISPPYKSDEKLGDYILIR